jgi:UDP-N-acetylglucosamine acyltransferase
MGATIHPLAVVDPGAELGADVEIGPFCMVGPNVRLGARVKLRSHVNVEGHTTLGAGCEIWPFANVGGKTQDLKFKGGAPRLVVGENTVIRECATLNCATYDGGETRVGSKCLIMAYSHIAHDCIVGDRVIMANNATLAGHILVEDDAILGGLAAVHQFVRIGRMSIVGGYTKTVKDIPPYMLADGNPVQVYGPNKIGLERHGVSPETQHALKEAYKIVFRTDLTVAKALERVEAELGSAPEVRCFVEFIRKSERGIAK